MTGDTRLWKSPTNTLCITSNTHFQELIGDATNVVDLDGKTVTLGLIDAHNHLQVWGTLLDSFEPLVPPEIRTLDDLLVRSPVWGQMTSHFIPSKR